MYFDFFALVTAALERARFRLASADVLEGLYRGEDGVRERALRVGCNDVRDLKFFKPRFVSFAGLRGAAGGARPDVAYFATISGVEGVFGK